MTPTKTRAGTAGRPTSAGPVPSRRMSSSLLACGIAVEVLTAEVFPDLIRTLLAVVLLLLGVFLSVGAAVRWYKDERSLRHQTPLPLIAPLLRAGGAIVFGA